MHKSVGIYLRREGFAGFRQAGYPATVAGCSNSEPDPRVLYTVRSSTGYMKNIRPGATTPGCWTDATWDFTDVIDPATGEIDATGTGAYPDFSNCGGPFGTQMFMELVELGPTQAHYNLKIVGDTSGYKYGEVFVRVSAPVTFSHLAWDQLEDLDVDAVPLGTGRTYDEAGAYIDSSGGIIAATSVSSGYGFIAPTRPTPAFFMQIRSILWSYSASKLKGFWEVDPSGLTGLHRACIRSFVEDGIQSGCQSPIGDEVTNATDGVLVVPPQPTILPHMRCPGAGTFAQLYWEGRNPHPCCFFP